MYFTEPSSTTDKCQLLQNDLLLSEDSSELHKASDSENLSLYDKESRKKKKN